MYKYELHSHTSEVSSCAKISACDMVDFYKSMGFTGIFITDHFFNGNTTVGQNQSWTRMVYNFMEGYKLAKEHGDRIGIDVFFGFEYSYHGTDVLVYGFDEQWLLEHSYIMNMKFNEFLKFAREEGALLIHAHPFRQWKYIDMIRLFPRSVDGVETFNACRTDFENDRAKEYAQNYNLLCTGGTDNHVGRRQTLGGMEFEDKIKDVNDFIQKIKNKEGKIFRMDLE